MKKIEIFNIGFINNNGQKLFGISTIENFSKNFISAEAETLIPVKPHGTDECLMVPKRAILWAARSVLSVLNENVLHHLYCLTPTKNVELISEILSRFTHYTNAVLFDENDPSTNPLNAWRISLADKNIH